MSSKTTSAECERVARYIMESGKGLTPSDIPDSIISRDRVFNVLDKIRSVKRFKTKSRKVKIAVCSFICPDGRIQEVWKTWVYSIDEPDRGVSIPVKATMGEIELRFSSIAEADKVGGFSGPCIRACLSGKQTHHAGYKWERLNAEDRQKAK
ncbi:MAG: hypothetical protein ACRCVV_21365 [Shewanella sp.]